MLQKPGRSRLFLAALNFFLFRCFFSRRSSLSHALLLPVSLFLGPGLFSVILASLLLLQSDRFSSLPVTEHDYGSTSVSYHGPRGHVAIPKDNHEGGVWQYCIPRITGAGLSLTEPAISGCYSVREQEDARSAR